MTKTFRNLKKAEEIVNDVINKKMKKEIIDFFKKNPNPDDDKLHNWAKSKGYDVYKVESAVYELATKFVNILTSGRAIEKGLTEKDVDPKELKMGIEIEYEHTPDKDVAKRIALDHLAENKNYYTTLKKMEKELGVE